jgi:hypothetical protein
MYCLRGTVHNKLNHFFAEMTSFVDFKVEMEKLLPRLGKIELASNTWSNFCIALTNGELDATNLPFVCADIVMGDSKTASVNKPAMFFAEANTP